MPALKPSQRLTILDVIPAQAAAAGVVASNWVKASQDEWFAGLAQMGTPGAGGTFQVKLQQAQDNAGTGAKDIIATVSTVQTAAGAVLVQTKMDGLDINNGFAFVRLAIVVGTATSPMSGLLFGLHDRQGPSNLNAVAALLQIVG